MKSNRVYYFYNHFELFDEILLKLWNGMFTMAYFVGLSM